MKQLARAVFCAALAQSALAQDSPSSEKEQLWNLHLQNTDILQGVAPFPARYSGPNSLNSSGEIRETISVDVFAGVRLWRGAEAHLDALVWEGFGVSKTVGVEGYPNGEAFRLGTYVPNINLARVFIRQTIPLGGDERATEDDALHLRSISQSSSLTLTAGRMSAKDIFDNNTYANDARTQFLNWALMANEAWDYPADSLGYMTGLAAELTENVWTLRGGFFQMPRVANGVALDAHFLKAWGSVLELERRYEIHEHPGAVRLLGYLNRAHMGSYREAVENPLRPPMIDLTRAYRYKYGLGLNLEQEVSTNFGIFSRLGWANGQTEAWTFADVDRTATAGLSVKGGSWRRPADVLGLAGVINGISHAHQQFFRSGGVGILAGDSTLNYAPEQILETYYSFSFSKSLSATLDYQYVVNPAFNRDRGPASIFSGRLHWAL